MVDAAYGNYKWKYGHAYAVIIIVCAAFSVILYTVHGETLAEYKEF
jgi:hypothetical protein